MVLLIQQLGRWRDYPREKVMDVKSLRTPISNVLAAIGVVHHSFCKFAEPSG
jgi:hypothetical protein